MSILCILCTWCVASFATGLALTEEAVEWIFSSPIEDNIVQLLCRVFLLPFYTLVLGIAIALSPIWGPVFIYHESEKVRKFLGKFGDVIVNFFSQKPLQGLKNYRIKIEKK